MHNIVKQIVFEGSDQHLFEPKVCKSLQCSAGTDYLFRTEKLKLSVFDDGMDSVRRTDLSYPIICRKMCVISGKK